MGSLKNKSYYLGSLNFIGSIVPIFDEAAELCKPQSIQGHL